MAHFEKNHEKSSILPKLATFRTNYHVSAFSSTRPDFSQRCWWYRRLVVIVWQLSFPKASLILNQISVKLSMSDCPPGCCMNRDLTYFLSLPFSFLHKTWIPVFTEEAKIDKEQMWKDTIHTFFSTIMNTSYNLWR